jgi:hypothetical protein
MGELSELDSRIFADGLTYPKWPRCYGKPIYLSDVYAYRVVSVTPGGGMRPFRRFGGASRWAGHAV